MKLNLGKRILLIVHWVFSLLILALVMLTQFSDGVRAALGSGWGLAILILLAVINIGLAAAVAYTTLFKRDPAYEHGFITVDSSDTGKVRISVSAVEQMVRQAVRSVDGIADMKIVVDSVDEAIDIQANVTMVNGSHVPTVTLSMQRAIRRYVEMNSGVAVHAVSVSIQAVTAPADGMKRPKRSALKPALPAQPEVEETPAEEIPVVEVPVEEVPVEEVPFEETVEYAEQPVEESFEAEPADSEVIIPEAPVYEELEEDAADEEVEFDEYEEFSSETAEETEDEDSYFSEEDISVESFETVEEQIEDAVEADVDEFVEEEDKN